ncbi:MAG: endonuclease domain-containing protein [Rhizobiaceae bacterium]|nr:endonuclease domain-containing protein [Rhizobiaceae bacterium]
MIEKRGRSPLPNGERVDARRSGEVASDPTKRADEATSRARRLRANDTEPEYRFWGELRGRRLNGYKFVRQVPLGPYVVDFLCRERLLVVELDGSQHAGSIGDARRDLWLNGQGYSVLRFWNDEVLKERRAVLETVLAVLDGRVHAPSPGLRFAPATLSPLGRGGRQSRVAAGLAKAKTLHFDVKNGVKVPPLPNGERVAGAKRRPGEGASSKTGRQRKVNPGPTSPQAATATGERP